MEWIIYDLCPVKMGNARKYGLDYIKKLPVVLVSKKEQKPIIELVNKIEHAKNNNKATLDLENKLDDLVYDLYNLTEDEKRIIEDSVFKRVD